MEKKTRFTKGGKREGAGRKKINGNNPKTTTVCLDASILDICKEKHGSLANALRYAAKMEYPSVETVSPSKGLQT